MVLTTAHSRSVLTAALGPTNTGKTHRAVERMLEHDSGMIGLPLRLLAREIYDRATSRVGESRVALVTGEEKRIPPRASYWVCTTEAMPVDREVDFLAVDEVQLAAHHQRGHVFTDRLLRARGKRETWFMGSDTMRPLVEQLVPAARVEGHPRFSSLTSAGSVTLSTLPARSAVVAFTAPQVYEIAERLRGKRGGAAVVLGALSPRTRNAQVAMYQSGEVQYLVATDAIGMGLNLDVDVVAFASLRKFDGRDVRPLEPAELAQIAGRAGRHLRDGRFATLAPLPPLSDELVFALETHRFAPVQKAYWRNTDLAFSSLEELMASLLQRPPRACLRRVEHAEDLAALEYLAKLPDIRTIATSAPTVALLWQVCQIPDYRQLLAESHARLLYEIFLQLAGPGGKLSPSWMQERIDRIDDVDGDIETLMARISFIRTWTYVANKPDWIRDEQRWQDRTRQVEDRLSDALHERLVQRFVEPGRARARSMSRRRPGVVPAPASDHPIAAHGPFRALAALRLKSSPDVSGFERAGRDNWVNEVVDAAHDAFRVDDVGKIWWRDRCVGRMTGGVDVLRPDVAPAGDDISPGARLRVQRRLLAFTRDYVQQLLSPLRRDAAEALSPAGRGLVYQLELGLGTVTAGDAQEQIRLLAPSDWKLLRALDVCMGRKVSYVRGLLHDDAIRARRTLVAVARGRPIDAAVAGAAEAFVVPPDADERAMTAIGYPVFGTMAIRADLVERMVGLLSSLASQGPFAMPARVTQWLGCGPREASLALVALGFVEGADGWRAKVPKRPGRRRQPGTGRSASQASGASERGTSLPTRTRAGRSNRSPS